MYTGLSAAVVRAAKFDAVEAFNSQSAQHHNAQARAVAEELGLPVTGGSDAHAPFRVSLGYLTMDLEPESTDAAIAQILKGKNKADGRHPRFGAVLARSVDTAARWVLRGGRRI